jgi:hypothetical protein
VCMQCWIEDWRGATRLGPTLPAGPTSLYHIDTSSRTVQLFVALSHTGAKTSAVRGSLTWSTRSAHIFLSVDDSDAHARMAWHDKAESAPVGGCTCEARHTVTCEGSRAVRNRIARAQMHTRDAHSLVPRCQAGVCVTCVSTCNTEGARVARCSDACGVLAAHTVLPIQCCP